MQSLFGEWRRADKIFGKMTPGNMRSLMKKALLKMLLYYKRIIVKNIRSSGQLVGKPFVKNADMTKRLKGSTKPLIDTGDMMFSITEKIISAVEGFVGLKRGDTHISSGEDLADIGEVNEFGAVLGETKAGKVIIIPARPFIRPVIESKRHQKEALKIYEETIMKGLLI